MAPFHAGQSYNTVSTSTFSRSPATLRLITHRQPEEVRVALPQLLRMPAFRRRSQHQHSVTLLTCPPAHLPMVQNGARNVGHRTNVTCSFTACAYLIYSYVPAPFLSPQPRLIAGPSTPFEKQQCKSSATAAEHDGEGPLTLRMA